MKLKIIRATTYEEKDTKTGEVKEMQRLLIRDEKGNADVIRVPVGASGEDIAKAWADKLKSTPGIQGKEIGLTVKE